MTDRGRLWVGAGTGLGVLVVCLFNDVEPLRAVVSGALGAIASLMLTVPLRGG